MRYIFICFFIFGIGNTFAQNKIDVSLDYPETTSLTSVIGEFIDHYSDTSVYLSRFRVYTIYLSKSGKHEFGVAISFIVNNMMYDLISHNYYAEYKDELIIVKVNENLPKRILKDLKIKKIDDIVEKKIRNRLSWASVSGDPLMLLFYKIENSCFTREFLDSNKIPVDYNIFNFKDNGTLIKLQDADN
jgi:hypothetical protein